MVPFPTLFASILYSLTEFYHTPANIIKNGSRMNRPPKRNTSEPCI